MSIRIRATGNDSDLLVSKGLLGRPPGGTSPGSVSGMAHRRTHRDRDREDENERVQRNVSGEGTGRNRGVKK